MIINRILEKLGIGDGSFNSDAKSRRKFIRHQGLQAEVVVAEQSVGVMDWSLGGLSFLPLVNTPLVAGDRVQFQLKFRLPHETISITQTGKVVRAVKRGVAAEFLPLSPETRRKFERVLDGVHAQGFLTSQLA